LLRATADTAKPPIPILEVANWVDTIPVLVVTIPWWRWPPSATRELILISEVVPSVEVLAAVVPAVEDLTTVVPSVVVLTVIPAVVVLTVVPAVVAITIVPAIVALTIVPVVVALPIIPAVVALAFIPAVVVLAFIPAVEVLFIPSVEVDTASIVCIVHIAAATSPEVITMVPSPARLETATYTIVQSLESIGHLHKPTNSFQVFKNTQHK